jgi:glutaredoxin 3
LHLPRDSGKFYAVDEPLKLYVKTWCPWCIRAKAWLDGKGYHYEEIDVDADRAAYETMIRLSGQRLTPTLVVGEQILPDFGPEELEPFLARNGIAP